MYTPLRRGTAHRPRHCRFRSKVCIDDRGDVEEKTPASISLLATPRTYGERSPMGILDTSQRTTSRNGWDEFRVYGLTPCGDELASGSEQGLKPCDSSH